MSKILLTGAGGRIGRRLLAALQGSGYAVLGTTRSRTGFTRADLCLPEDVERLFEAHPEIDVVLHAAGVAHAERVKSGKEYFRGNSRATRLLCDAARAHGVRQFVFFSTVDLYAPEALEKGAHEESPVSPVTAYGRSKAVAEAYLEKHRGGMEVTVLRLAPVYAAEMMKDVEKRVFLAGTGIAYRFRGEKARFSLCHIESVVEAVRLLLEGRLPPSPEGFSVLNVADAHAYTRGDMLLMSAGAERGPWVLTLPARGITACARWLQFVPDRRAGELASAVRKLRGPVVIDVSRLLRAGFQGRGRVPEGEAVAAGADLP